MRSQHQQKATIQDVKINQQETIIYQLLKEKSDLTSELVKEKRSCISLEAEKNRLMQAIADLTRTKRMLALLEEEKKTLLFKLDAQKKLTAALIEGFEQTKHDQQAEIEKLEQEVALLKASQQSSDSKRTRNQRAFSKTSSFFKTPTQPTPPKTPTSTSFRRQ